MTIGKTMAVLDNTDMVLRTMSISQLKAMRDNLVSQLPNKDKARIRAMAIQRARRLYLAMASNKKA